ncbi:Stk1 family PASTA domain-containing Ser/Thr kinase [Gryllotalpicola reticulitermitis]|uniref:non-specific serine/threonine protein kinase n=1 Tax=Gryllotalpicola reticulitermitis TaxID=1184153 RepID=A0ABV8Q6K7_9MICO
MAPVTPATPRMVAGRYEVGELLGRGGMSDVHKGTDTRLGRPVAIKLLKPQLASDPAFRTRFRQEAQAAARMAHPTIVRVFDAGEDTVRDVDGREVQAPFIIMEYVDGAPLDELVRRGQIDPMHAIRITEGILTALEYSHRAGVVHRDIKPANVMITRQGQVKVMDFGIARAISETSASLSHTTAILGTANYFSPEQAKGEQVDARTDLYSTGVVLFEMLTGRPPFRGETPVAVAYQHISEIPVKPSSLNSKVSPALDLVLRKALQKDRFERYQTAAAFRADLEAAAEGRVPRTPRRVDASDALFAPPTTQLSKAEATIRQLADDSQMVRTQRRPPALWVVAGIITLMAVLAALLIWVVENNPSDVISSSSATVPSVTGDPLAQAQTAMKVAHLKMSIEHESSATVPSGSVTRTDPSGGFVTQKNADITVWVSSGPPLITVPNVVGKSDAAAQAALTGDGFEIGYVHQQDDQNAPKGQVLSTDPAAQTQGHKGDTVNLTESNGQVHVTDTTGQPLQTAQTELNNLGLRVTATPDSTCQVQQGTPVTRQSIVGDQPQGAAVTVYYCTGSAPAAPPAPTPTTAPTASN